MNRYPLWKYVLIGVALVGRLLYTLPNFFPEVPAVQVSSSKATVKVDAARSTVETRSRRQHRRPTRPSTRPASRCASRH